MIKLELPDSFLTSHSIQLRITDMNYGNHVGNDVFISLIHEARVLFLNELGYSEKNIEGFAIIMRNLQIEYRSELIYPDLINIEVGIKELRGASFILSYLIRKNDNSVAAVCETELTFFDYNLKKIIRTPINFIEKLKEFEFEKRS